MGIGILYDPEQEKACLFCNTSDCAFGPIITNYESLTAQEIAESFLRWYEKKYNDPRIDSVATLEDRYMDFVVLKQLIEL